MAVSKKLRFEVFRRDNFACRYCGRSAQDERIVLEPDHVVPRSRGGKDVAANLVTACEDCNSGKSDTPISAPTIEDVPQEIFRQACLEKGSDGLYLEEVEDLATEILSDFRKAEIDGFLEDARDWLACIDEPNPSEQRLCAQAAVNANHELHIRIRSLTAAIDRFLQTCGSPEVWTLYDAARAHLQNNKGIPDPANCLVVLEAANRWLQEEDRRLLDSIPAEQANEWLAYADALVGDDGVGRLEGEDRVRHAAHVLRLERVARGYPGMCGGQGEHISSCPRRAEFRFWAKSTCPECEHPNLTRAEGNVACASHLKEIQDGELRCKVTGLPAELLDVKALDAGEKEQV